MTRLRSFWGWGYADEMLSETFVQRFTAVIQAGLGIKPLPPIEPPRLDELQLRAPRFDLPSELMVFCSDQTFDRASHSYGKSFRDIVRGLYRQFPNPPDYVAYPRYEEDIVALMAFCRREQVALIPYGGGSSVVGGVEPTDSEQYRGVITADLCHLDQILQVDPLSRSARVQAGIYGPALEAGLKPHGFTLRHYPQSFEFSTVGGWIATRSGGHFATLYTHIDEFVQSLRMVTPQGIVETRRLPASGAGPDSNRLLLGSEGVLGIITEAWLRLQRIPTERASATVQFGDETAAFAAVRQISQSKLFPANCRLVSAIEALSMGLGNGQDTVLLLGFEAHDVTVDGLLHQATTICEQHGGQVAIPSQGRGKAAENWRNSFIKAPYLRDRLVAQGLVMETFETAVTWGNFPTFHKNVLHAAESALKEQCGHGVVTWRFTHVYPDGPAPYYTVIGQGKRGREIEQWDAIKQAASEAIFVNGGTITHHHAVGKDHRHWYLQELDPLLKNTLAAAKQTLDPEWILNPDVLLPAATDPNFQLMEK